ncbi:MAG: OmpH family outer membrane protein [Porphyromonadaceae bacterium]|nr:OmpH family outer membrane protein [Porphyromonadaceae bacterium]
MKKVLLPLLVLVMPLMVFSQDLKVGYIDAEQIMMAMPEIADIEKQMSEYNAQNTKYLQEMEAEIQKEEAKYKEMEATATATMKADQEAKIQTLYQRYQTTVRTIQQDAQQKQASLLKPVQERVVKAIESVGSKNNYLFILDKNTMIYKSAKTVDVTAIVKKELNIK